MTAEDEINALFDTALKPQTPVSNYSPIVSTSSPVVSSVLPTPAPTTSIFKGALAGQEPTFEAAGQKYGVDPDLLMSMAAFETGWGTSKRAREDYNIAGITEHNNPSKYMTYDSIQEGIDAQAKLVREGYLDKGLTTVPQIAAEYAPPGAENDPKKTNAEWPGAVQSIYDRLKKQRGVSSALAPGSDSEQTLATLPRPGTQERKAPEIDPQSATQLASLVPDIQPLATDFLSRAKQWAQSKGLDVRITEGLRTPERQNELYAQGRTTPGPIVTNAKAGQSNHQSARAFDVAIYKNGKEIEDKKLWGELGKIGKATGLEWGGDFKSIYDPNHFQKLGHDGLDVSSKSASALAEHRVGQSTIAGVSDTALDYPQAIDLPGHAIQTPRVVLGDPKDVPGLEKPGNIDLTQDFESPAVMEKDGKALVIPATTDDTETNFGTFKDEKTAQEYADRLRFSLDARTPQPYGTGIAGVPIKQATGVGMDQETLKKSQVDTITPGNIDLDKRKVFENPNGQKETELPRWMPIEGGKIALIPTIIDGKLVGKQEAEQHYKKSGEHLGIFANPAAAEEYIYKLRNRQEEFYGMPSREEIQPVRTNQSVVGAPQGLAPSTGKEAPRESAAGVPQGVAGAIAAPPPGEIPVNALGKTPSAEPEVRKAERAHPMTGAEADEQAINNLFDAALQGQARGPAMSQDEQQINALFDTALGKPSAKAEEKPYFVEGNQIHYIPGKFRAGLKAAKEDGIIDEKTFQESQDNAEDVDKAAYERKQLEIEAGDNPAAWSALQGFGKGAAMTLGGITAGAVGAAVAPAAGPLAPAVPIVTGVAGMVAAGAAYDYTYKKLAEWNQDYSKVMAATKVRPGYNAAGQLAFLAMDLPVSAVKLAGAAKTVAAAEGKMAAAKFVGKVTGLGAATGAGATVSMQLADKWLGAPSEAEKARHQFLARKDFNGEKLSKDERTEFRTLDRRIKEAPQGPSVQSTLEGALLGGLTSGLFVNGRHFSLKDLGGIATKIAKGQKVSDAEVFALQKATEAAQAASTEGKVKNVSVEQATSPVGGATLPTVTIDPATGAPRATPGVPARLPAAGPTPAAPVVAPPVPAGSPSGSFAPPAVTAPITPAPAPVPATPAAAAPAPLVEVYAIDPATQMLTAKAKVPANLETLKPLKVNEAMFKRLIDCL